MWQWFINGIFEILKQIYLLVGDWGLAIILLTVMFRLLLTPLMIKQVKSTYELQKVQPLMKKIQEKYKDDKEKQSQKLQELYAEHKINPFASCLPMLLQMPLFIALYQVLAAPITTGKTPKPGGPLAIYIAEHAAEEGVGSFFGILPDIMKSASAVFKINGVWGALPYVILLALFALSMWIPQLMTPGDKNQKMIGLYMAAFMLFIGWSTPAGVLLYWDTSSIIGIAQQWYTQNSMKKVTEESAEIVVDKPKKKKSAKKEG